MISIKITLFLHYFFTIITLLPTTGYLHIHLPVPRAVVLAEVDPLPCAQHEPAVLDDDLLGEADEIAFRSAAEFPSKW